MDQYEASSFYSDQEDLPRTSANHGRSATPIPSVARPVIPGRTPLPDEDDNRSEWQTIRPDQDSPVLRPSDHHYDDLIKHEPLSPIFLGPPPGSPPKGGLPSLPRKAKANSAGLPSDLTGSLSGSHYDSELLLAMSPKTSGTMHHSRGHGHDCGFADIPVGNPFTSEVLRLSGFPLPSREKEISEDLRKATASSNENFSPPHQPAEVHDVHERMVKQSKHQGFFYRKDAISSDWNTGSGIKIPVQSVAQQQVVRDPSPSPRLGLLQVPSPTGGDND
jgi:hypothetical protein